MQVIKDRRVKTAEPEKPLRFLKKIERPAPRPPTPAVEVPSEVFAAVIVYLVIVMFVELFSARNLFVFMLNDDVRLLYRLRRNASWPQYSCRNSSEAVPYKTW